MRKLLLAGTWLAAIALVWAAPAHAQKGRTMAVLVPGAGGPVPQDFLMRNRGRFTAAGIETEVATSVGQAASIVRARQQSGRKVVVVGMSKGAPTAAAAAASSGAAGLVLVSGIYNRAMAALGSPARLPRTLVVEHRRDECPLTLPEYAQNFVRWAHGKASIRWIDTRGEPVRRPCGPFAAHGFFTKDGPAVSAIIGFIKSR
jgi:predicted esterase